MPGYLYCVRNLLILALTVTVFGCGGGEEVVEGRKKVVPVKGTVMYQGKPLAGATVMFHSADQGVTANGMTDDAGKFILKTYGDNDGAVPGPHKVTVKKVELKVVPNPKDPNLDPISSTEIWLTPKDYATRDKTPLTLTVGPDGEEDIQVLVGEDKK